MKRGMLLLAVSIGLGLALVRAYSVSPRTAAMSGWTGILEPNNSVSEIVTCCWDSLGGTSGGYVELSF